MIGHWEPLDMGIERGSIGGGNLAYDPVMKGGVLKEPNSVRLGRDKEKPSGNDDIGTSPFMALDLLDNWRLKGTAPRLYRYDAESFAWCFIWTCICMKKDAQGRIRMIYPNPFSSWYWGVDSYSWRVTHTQRLLEDALFHRSSKHIATMFCSHWVWRSSDKQANESSAESESEPDMEGKDFLEHLLSKYRKTVPKKRGCTEPSDRHSFKQAFQLILHASSWVPESKGEVFMETVRCVVDRYKFVISRDPVP